MEEISSAILGLGMAPAIPQYGLHGSRHSPYLKSALVRQAVESGIGYIDTAANYGDAERYLGELSQTLAEKQIRVCTKLTKTEFPGGLHSSLERLRCDRLDTLLLHSPTNEDLLDGSVAEAFGVVREMDRVSRTGASTYGTQTALSALEQPWCDVLQVEHSILNPSVAPDVTKSRGDLELVVRSVLCKGLLTERRRHMPAGYAEIVSLVDDLEKLAVDWDYTLPELAVRYAMDTPGVNVVLIGVGNPIELETVLSAQEREPLEKAQMLLLGQFDRSSNPAVHPEQWKL